MNSAWQKAELEIGGTVRASRMIRPHQTEAVMKSYKIATKATRDEWAIFIIKPSKANRLIKLLNDDEEGIPKKQIASKSRTFDIWEISRLRKKGDSWVKVAQQLYTNERTVREYFNQHKNELTD